MFTKKYIRIFLYLIALSIYSTILIRIITTYGMHVNALNDTSRSKIDSDHSTTNMDIPKDALHLFQEFFILNSEGYRRKMGSSLTNEMIEKRQRELNYCLQRNLLHNSTSSITILHNDEGIEQYISELHLKNFLSLM